MVLLIGVGCVGVGEVIEALVVLLAGPVCVAGCVASLGALCWCAKCAVAIAVLLICASCVGVDASGSSGGGSLVGEVIVGASCAAGQFGLRLLVHYGSR